MAPFQGSPSPTHAAAEARPAVDMATRYIQNQHDAPYLLLFIEFTGVEMTHRALAHPEPSKYLNPFHEALLRQVQENYSSSFLLGDVGFVSSPGW